jgi:hypothetical protein
MVRVDAETMRLTPPVTNDHTAETFYLQVWPADGEYRGHFVNRSVFQ